MPQVEIIQGTSYRLTFKAYLSSDHVSPATGKTLAIVLNKNHAGFANPSIGTANATETPGNSYGWYYFDLSATDTSSVGPLIARATATGVDDSEVILQVVPGALGVRSVNVASVAGVAAALAEGSAQAVTGSSITLDLPTNDKRTANNLTNWEVEVVSATTGSGQRAFISGYNPATQVATVAWPTTTPSLPLTYNLRAPVTVIRNLDKTGTMLGTGAITPGSFSAGAITFSTFAAGAIDSNAFAQSAADKVWGTAARSLTDKANFGLATGAIGNTTFAAGAISNTTLANGTLSTATFAPGSITNGLFAAGAIDSNAFAQSAADLAWNTAVRSLTSIDKTGYSLAPTGLDAIPLTPPTAAPATFREALVMVYRRFFKKVVTTNSTIVTYADDGTTVITTQPISSNTTNGSV